MDDSELGWYLRIADLMAELGGVPDQEQFCDVTQVRPWVTQAWLGEILFQLVDARGGMNGIDVLTAVIVVLALRRRYTRMVADGGELARRLILVAFGGPRHGSVVGGTSERGHAAGDFTACRVQSDFA